MKKVLLQRAFPERFHIEPPVAAHNINKYPTLPRSSDHQSTDYDFSSRNSNLVLHPIDQESRPISPTISNKSLSPTLSTIFPELYITPLGCYKEDAFLTEIRSNEPPPLRQPPINCVEQLMQLKNIEVYIVPGSESTLGSISPSSESLPERVPSIPSPLKSDTEDLSHVYTTEETKNSLKPLQSSSNDHTMTPLKLQPKPTAKITKRRTPRKRKPLVSDNVKPLLTKSEVNEDYAMTCLYGENMDKFRELVTVVAIKNEIQEDEVKAIFSNNRRKVKNRGSARRSRLTKNDRLQSLRDECISRRALLSRKKKLLASIVKLKEKKSKYSNLMNTTGKEKTDKYNSVAPNVTTNCTNHAMTVNFDQY